MARPRTKPVKFKNGFYIEVRNKGSKTGIKLRKETKEEMIQAAKDLDVIKDVIIYGESKNGKWVNKPES